VACPENSFGSSVPDGCDCNAGFEGTIVASLDSPYYTGECLSGCESTFDDACALGALCFPGTGDTDVVLLNADDFTYGQRVYTMSTCTYFNTESLHDHALMSWATDDSADTFSIRDPVKLHLQFDDRVFPESEADWLNYADGEWHLVCAVFDSASGDVQLFVDGVETHSQSGWYPGYYIPEGGHIAWGQTQGCNGDCFDDSAQYVGYQRFHYIFNNYMLRGGDVSSMYEDCDVDPSFSSTMIVDPTDVCSVAENGGAGNINNVALGEAGW